MSDVRERKKSSKQVDSAKTPTEKPTAQQIQQQEEDDYIPGNWLDPNTWTLSQKFFPAYVLLLAIFIWLYVFRDTTPPQLDVSMPERCLASFNYPFDATSTTNRARKAALSAREVGGATEAFLELFSPDKSVFGSDPFPNGYLPPVGMSLEPHLQFADKQQKFNVYGKTLYDEDNANATDAAMLGIPALMLGQKRDIYLEAATRQKDILLTEIPKFINGAISRRFGQAEITSDTIATFAPFLAYYGVANHDLDIMREAVRQCELYRDVLSIESGRTKGLWRHVVGPAEMADENPWSLGNALAALGMTRVRATISSWPTSDQALTAEKKDLDGWIEEIVDGAIKTDEDASGLLRNYLGDDSWFAEATGTAFMTAVVYRMAVLKPQTFAQEKYLSWAQKKREALLAHIDNFGKMKPVVDPLHHDASTPLDLNVEGEISSLFMIAAYRDCVCANDACRLQYYLDFPPPDPSDPGTPWKRTLNNFRQYFNGPGGQEL